MGTGKLQFRLKSRSTLLKHMAERYPDFDLESVELNSRIHAVAKHIDAGREEALAKHGLSQGKLFVLVFLFTEELSGRDRPRASEIASWRRRARRTSSRVKRECRRYPFSRSASAPPCSRSTSTTKSRTASLGASVRSTAGQAKAITLPTSLLLSASGQSTKWPFRGRRAGAGDLLDDKRRGERVAAGPAVGLGDVHRVEVRLHQGLVHVPGELGGPVDVRRPRRDLVIRERAHRFTQRLVLFRECKGAHAQMLTLSRSAA